MGVVMAAVLTEYDADIRDMSVQEGGRTILAGGRSMGRPLH